MIQMLDVVTEVMSQAHIEVQNQYAQHDTDAALAGALFCLGVELKRAERRIREAGADVSAELSGEE